MELSGCILHKNKPRDDGYAICRVNGSGSKYAHRHAWEVAHGPIPAGLHVCHKCDVRNCVNPEHLFLGTQSDNIKDMYSKGRGVVKAGGGPHVKLSWDKVRQIRALRAEKGLKEIEIARQFDISRGAINHILRNKTWRESWT